MTVHRFQAVVWAASGLCALTLSEPRAIANHPGRHAAQHHQHHQHHSPGASQSAPASQPASTASQPTNPTTGQPSVTTHHRTSASASTATLPQTIAGSSTSALKQTSTGTQTTSMTHASQSRQTSETHHLIRELEETRRLLEQGRHDYNGHRLQAIHEIDRAIRDLEGRHYPYHRDAHKTSSRPTTSLTSASKTSTSSAQHAPESQSPSNKLLRAASYQLYRISQQIESWEKNNHGKHPRADLAERDLQQAIGDIRAALEDGPRPETQTAQASSGKKNESPR